MRRSVAIHDAYRSEPSAIDPTVDRHSIEFDFIVSIALVRPEPALRNTRVPVEFALLRFEKPLRQAFRCASSEFDFEPCDKRRHHSIRRNDDWLKHAHVSLLS